MFSCFFPFFCSWSQWLHTLLSQFWSCLATRLISRPALLHRPRLNTSSCLTGAAAEVTGLLCWVFGFCNWVSLLCSFTVRFFFFGVLVLLRLRAFTHMMMFSPNIPGLLLFPHTCGGGWLLVFVFMYISVSLLVSAFTPDLTKGWNHNPHCWWTCFIIQSQEATSSSSSSQGLFELVPNEINNRWTSKERR